MQGMTRRHFMTHVAGASALAIPGMQFLSGLRAAEQTLKKENKSLIILWMGGGPSHLDLWDLKPGSQNGGEFKPIKTKADGLQISEVLPTIADQMQHLSIVRSLVTNEGSHDRGTVLMNTGKQPNPVVQFPAMGAVASSLLTSKDLPLPGFIGVGGVAQRIGPGFLGMAYAPFTVQNPGQPPENVSPPGSLGTGDDQEERLRRRQRLFSTLEGDFGDEAFPTLKTPESREAAGSAAQAHEGIYKKGFDLTISPLKDVFNVKDEKKETIDMYGGARNNFGMGCLLARKLVEKGVTCVEVDLGGWDNHAQVFNAIRGTGNNMGNGNRLDKGMGALVKDLVDRGMWKNTVVLWMGEFGRTPKINQNNGRDHWARVWSVVVGGGAIQGGQVYGATSADGTDPDTSAVPTASLGDLFATVYKGMGLDPTTQIRDNLGRPLSIAEGKPLKGLV
ncbi:MAG TPA: DUF1501 domain-containing protein [Gemmataceae bacterium]|nr:DUF1501 domain-containing protein [Gemmataceae bacterium]